MSSTDTSPPELGAWKPEPFRPRAVTTHGTLACNGWRVKLYGIRVDPEPLDWDDYEDALGELVSSHLPDPDPQAGRPGLGFAIVHRGREACYLVLAWWDRENELPVRVFLKEPGGDDSWRPARAGESFCVWDLSVFWFERRAWIETMLVEKPDAAAWLARRHREEA